MADYRDPKVTGGTKRDSGTSKWVGIAIAAVVVLLLIAWFSGAFTGAEVEPEPEVSAPATEAPATGTAPATETPAPATETPATEPAAPAQQ